MPKRTGDAILNNDSHPGDLRRADAVSGRARRGFTLIELLVVIGIIAVLAAMLLPVLAHAKFRAQVVNCTSNFKEWGQMAAMYAGDFNSVLPGQTMPPAGGGGNPWDIGLDFIPACANYGLTVPMWFCPARPGEIQAENTAALTGPVPPSIGKPLNSITNLSAFMGGYFGGFVVMNHTLWVRRFVNKLTSLPNPLPTYTVLNSVPYVWGWPEKTTDKCCGYVPFITDCCFAGYGTPVSTNIKDLNIVGANNSPLNTLDKYSGHVFNGTMESVNAAFADGHVELHGRSQIKCYYQNTGAADWFY